VTGLFWEPTLPLSVREVIGEAGASLLPQIGRTPEPKRRGAFIVSGEQTAALGAERGNAIWSTGFSPMAKFWLVGVETILCLKKKRPGLFGWGTRVLSQLEQPFFWLTVLFNDSLDLPVGQVNGPCVHPGVTSVLPLCLGRRRDVRADDAIFHTLFTADSRNKVLNSGNRGACPP
jgi:hypothetical protein